MHVSFSIFIATRPSDRGSQLLWSGLAFGLQYSLYVASERHWSHIHVITLCVDVGHARRLCTRREVGCMPGCAELCRGMLIVVSRAYRVRSWPMIAGRHMDRR